MGIELIWTIKDEKDLAKLREGGEHSLGDHEEDVIINMHMACWWHRVDNVV